MRRTTPAKIIQEHREDPTRDTDDCREADIEIRKLMQAPTGNTFGVYTPRRSRWKRPGMIGILELSGTRAPKVVEPGNVTRSVDYPSEALNGVLHRWYDTHGRPTGGVYRSEDPLDGFIIFSSDQAEDTEDDESDMWDDVDRDWVDYMRIRESKSRDPETVHENQTGLRDFRSARQADVNPAAISQPDPRLASLPAFLDEGEYTEVSKYTPGTGGPLVCDHCNSENWWSHPLESGIDALRPGGIEHGDPDCDPCHADDIKGCPCHACPRCSGLSIEFRVNSQDYRCNNCDLEFGHPVPAPSEFDGERGQLYWRCGECGRETQAPFVGIPQALLDDAPDAVFDD